MRVSRVLAAAGLTDTTWFTEESRQRGTAVHAIAEAVFQGHAVEVSPAFAGYKKAIEAGVKALAFAPVCVERRLVSEELTGRPDALGFVTRPTGSAIHAGPAIVDIKSGQPMPVHGIQLALYERLADANGLRLSLPDPRWDLPWNRIGLYVAATGRYEIFPYTDPSDYVVAQAALDLMRWRVAHGLLTDETDQPDDPAFPMMEAS
jgi:hypothetical protein